MTAAPQIISVVLTDETANPDAERAMLGSMILDNRLIDDAMGMIPFAVMEKGAESLFSGQCNQIVWDMIVRLHSKGWGVDLTVLAEVLMMEDLLPAVGGAVYIAGLEDDIFSLKMFPDYVRIVVLKWARRSVANVGAEIANDAGRTDMPTPQIIDLAEARLSGLTIAEERRGAWVIAGDTLPDVLEQFERAAAGDVKPRGISTGIADLDGLIGGLRPGKVYVIASRPSVGKSAFAQSIVAHVALRIGRPVGIVSMEMKAAEISARLIAMESGVALDVIEGTAHGSFDSADLVHAAAERIDKAPIYVEETARMTSGSISLRCRRLKTRVRDLALIVVDYLQLTESTGKKSDNRQIEIAEASRALKVLAGELNVPIIALSQLNRDIEKQTGKKKREPQLSDLRDSGAVEQDADVVAFLTRDTEPEAQTPYAIQDARLLIRKQRNGPLGVVNLHFLGAATRFTGATKGQ